jgi:hypothetical protein
VPDVDIFTAHISPPRRSAHVFPKVISTTQNALKNFRFRAGVESSISMLGLSLFAFMKDKGVLPASVSLVDFSAPLLQANKVLNMFSSGGVGQGGMIVDMTGAAIGSAPDAGAGDRPKVSLRWGLGANADTGPEIPCTPAVIIATKLHHLYKYRNAQVSSSSVVEPQYQPGARVCADMISLRDFTDAIHQDQLDIQQYVSCPQQASSLSPTFAALDHVTQTELPDPICAVHIKGGVVTGELLMSMSRFPLVRLVSMAVGLPVPSVFSKQRSFKFLGNMDKERWVWLATPADSTGGNSSPVSVFTSVFASNSDDHLLTESLLGGFLQLSMQQKAVTRLRDMPARASLGERPWIYDGFESVCVRFSVMFGLLPLPLWMTPVPHCYTAPHRDGQGWDLQVSLHWPLLGDVIRYEGPLRIARLAGAGGEDGSKERLAAVHNTYGTDVVSESLQKVTSPPSLHVAH